MSLDIEFEVPTWDQVYEMLLNIAEKIYIDGFCPDILVGISRGGWPPARVMSDLLGNPELANIGVEFYVEVAETKKEPVITQPVSIPVTGRSVLMLDDVADTGLSLKLATTHLMKQGAKTVKTATIYYKPWSVVTPDYYEKETKYWIVFPWERRETIRSLVKACKKEGILTERVKEKLAEGGMDESLAERFLNEVAKEDL